MNGMKQDDIQMDNVLTLDEFFAIQKKLNSISDTWSDLWALLYLSQVSPTRLLRLQYADVTQDKVVLRPSGKLVEKHIPLSSGISAIIHSRRIKYPEDIFLFQSHTNRMKAVPRQVTLIAFNTALKRATRSVTNKSVSSKSAFLGKLSCIIKKSLPMRIGRDKRDDHHLCDG